MSWRSQDQYELIEYNFSAHGRAHFEISRVSQSYVALHWHDAVEVICVIEGELSVTLDQHTHHLHGGDCIILNPYALHSTISQKGNMSLLLQIPVSAFEDCGVTLAHRQFICDPSSTDPAYRESVQRMTGHLKSIMAHEQDGRPGSRLLSMSELLEVIFDLYTCFSHPISDATTEKSQKNRERLTQIINYTEARYAQPITLEMIAEELHLQVNYFCHFFKQNTGMTYMNYLNDYRLAKVYHDLLVTDVPLKYLLERHGFTNYKKFRQSFFDKFGMTPGEMRNAKNSQTGQYPQTGMQRMTESPAS
ncbi:MAG: helix-turn-helix transcriptional regulator [Clostridia bacterium]|nr:helix-turn-helix transcriptional regulator [Clostridia bacterium]